MVSVKRNDPYAFSQKLYILECAFNYLITIITSGAYLAKLTTTIGIPDSLTAILSNLTSLAGVFQLVSIRLSHGSSLKRVVIPMQTGYNLLYGLLYLIPFFGLGTHVNSVLFFICVFSACVMYQISYPLKYSWFMALPAPEQRAPFTSAVHIFSHTCGIIFSFIHCQPAPRSFHRNKQPERNVYHVHDCNIRAFRAQIRFPHARQGEAA